MKKDFIWYWLEPEEGAYGDIYTSAFKGDIQNKHFSNYLDLLEEIKDKKDGFGILQEANLKIDGKIYAPFSWEPKNEYKSYPIDE